MLGRVLAGPVLFATAAALLLGWPHPREHARRR
jgi:hypothetical protein